jgi:hypothetical protein
MQTTIEQFFAEQREKFEKQRDEARAKLEEAEAELRAIDAYEAAKKAKPAQAAATDGERKQRAPRQTGKRNEVLKLVEQYPQGVTAGELKDKLSIKGDKSGEQSLSNALSALKKAGQLIQEDGKYKAAAA